MMGKLSSVKSLLLFVIGMIVTTSLPVSGDRFCRRLLRAADAVGAEGCDCDDTSSEGNDYHDFECDNYSIDIDGESGDFREAYAYFSATYEERMLLLMEMQLNIEDENLDGYTIPVEKNTLDIKVKGGEEEIESCSATIKSFDKNYECDCTCDLCNSRTGVEPNCDNCVLIPDGSGSNVSSLNPINYTTINCIDISFMIPTSEFCMELFRMKPFLPDDAMCTCSTDIICKLGEIDLDSESGGLPPVEVDPVYVTRNPRTNDPKVTLNFSGEFNGYEIPPEQGTLTISATVVRSTKFSFQRGFYLSDLFVRDCKAETEVGCDCECDPCHSKEGVRVDCRRCDLIPAGSGSDGLPLDDIKYPRTDTCIKMLDRK